MSTIALARYLWERIKEVGIRTVQGVPGDFNLQILDYIFEVEGLKWVGNANELNAAYSADGYSRVKGVPGVFVTTHGVGELSALNGVTGSYSEQVRVIHVVGQTTRKMQKERMMIHHSIDNDPDHQVYQRMSKPSRVAEAILQDPETAPAEIDRVIRECFVQSRPVYIFMPLDLSWEQVPKSLLDKKIDVSLPVDQSAQEAAASAIIEALTAARNPCVFMDVLVHRHGAVAEANNLVDKLRLPVYTSNMAKTLINDDHPCCMGIYNGIVSAPGVPEAFSQQDFTLLLGSLPADTNTGGFGRQIAADQCADVKPFEVTVNGKTYKNVFMKPLLAHLASRLGNAPIKSVSMPQLPPPLRETNFPKEKIVQEWVWQQLANFFRAGDVVLGDTGTCTFGLCDVQFPPGVLFTTQSYYGSIGWATPCALGCELACIDMAAEGNTEPRRTILVTGDGSFGLTMQEIGTMISAGTTPIVIIINNEGYTIERIIHGARQPYNNINKVNYSSLLQTFCHPAPETHYHYCADPASLLSTLSSISDAHASPGGLHLVEIIMDKLDVPWRLSAQLSLRGPAFVDYLREEKFAGWDGEGKLPVGWAGVQKALKDMGWKAKPRVEMNSDLAGAGV